MTLRPTLILLAAPMMLGLCVPSVDSGCPGWRAIRIDASTVDYLAESDPETLAGLIGHHESGKSRGCWK